MHEDISGELRDIVRAVLYPLHNNNNAGSKSTSMNRDFGAGWLGFGHSFAQEGEHDQAMAAYRSAARILHG